VSAYLVDHPPVRDQFRSPRREEPSGVTVLHTAENTPDTVATDGGAEAVARFIVTRTTPGSYHTLVDSDSRLRLIPWEMEAYQDGTGSNRHAVGLSVATRADWWPWAPKAWRDGAIENLAQAAAEYARWLYARRGIVIPPRRITREESERRVPGFISHAERDPDRRSDPGAWFPWTQFLTRYAELTADLGNTPLEDDMNADQERKLDEALGLLRSLVPRPPQPVTMHGERIGQVSADGKPAADLWRWGLESLFRTRALDPVSLAQQIAERLPSTAGPVKVTDLEEALRNVFGSLGEG